MHGSEASEHMRRLLRDDEQMLWNSKPQKKAFYVSGIVGGLFAMGFLGMFFAIPFFGFVAVLISGFVGSAESALAIASGLGILGVLVVVGLVYVMTRWRYKHAEFGLTDDRAIKTSGFIGRDASTISLADVRDIDVNVGILDKVFGTGKVKLQVAGGRNSGATFNYIDEPYEVMDTLEDARKQAEAAGAD